MKIKYIKLRGFTLIELITTIAIMAILAVFIVPKFIDLSSNAQTTVTNAIANTLSTANAENYSARIISTVHGARIRNCRNAANLLTGGLPTGYTITSARVGINATVSCTLNGPNSSTATFLVTGIR